MPVQPTFIHPPKYRLMKYFIPLFLLLHLGLLATAQNKKQLSLDLDRSFHGTGDMQGAGFAVEYGSYLGRRIELTAGLGANLHHAEEKLLLTQWGQTTDASYRMVTGGLQLHAQANLAPLRTRVHELKLGLGPVLRYQSSSMPNVYGITRDPNYPEPFFTFRNNEAQNLVTLGYLCSVSYSFTLPRQFLIGAKASFQNDTNSDVITQYGLRIGKRF